VSVTISEPALSPGLRGGPDSALLWVDRLTKDFPTGRRRLLGGGHTGEALRAVDGVSFDVRAGETFGLVGESGCGKSTLARCILRLTEPSGGRVVFDGTELGRLGRNGMRALRKRMQVVFQDPYASLDPRMTVGAIVEEPLVIHGLGNRKERRGKVAAMLELVGLTAQQARRKPHEFSGGQRQRIALARALVLSPELVILDEPVSALDVSIQAQVLNLLRSLQQELGLTYLFIVHDLAVAEYFCDRLAVLYLGAVMELAGREAVFTSPLHPYTDALLSAVPIPEPGAARRKQRVVLRGDVVHFGSEVRGCRFKPRCPVGRDRELCGAVEPPLEEREEGHWVACHFPGELAPPLVAAEPAVATSTQRNHDERGDA
jgi:oligopeptide/dipeptide ABC transporter ATP-binding protein